MMVTRPLTLTEAELENEHRRIVDFIDRQLAGDPAVVAVSGGLDSDVVARLTAEAVGRDRIKLFIVIQDDMDPRHVDNARALASDLRVTLAEVDMRGAPHHMISALSEAEPDLHFVPDGLLDIGRAKCSLRSALLSTYQDRGYVVMGNSNRTEWLTGFYLPLGDGLGHILPIVHLYKCQVAQLAEQCGTRQEVIQQPGSSGFWIGAEDQRDLAVWLYVGEPVRHERIYSQDEWDVIEEMASTLTRECVDIALDGLVRQQDRSQILRYCPFSDALLDRMTILLDTAKRKHRPLFQCLEAAE